MPVTILYLTGYCHTFKKHKELCANTTALGVYSTMYSIVYSTSLHLTSLQKKFDHFTNKIFPPLDNIAVTKLKL